MAMAKERPVAPRHTRWHVDCPACLNAGRHEMFIIGPEVTFSEGAAQWIESRKVKAPGTRSRYVSENTLWDYETYVRALNKMFAGTPLGEFKKPHTGLGLLREYHRLRSLGHDPDDPEGPHWAHPASPNKINQEVGMLIRILKVAGCWTQDLEDNFQPLQRIEADVPRAMTPQEQAHWLATAHSCDRWQFIYHYSVFALQTVMSTNELRGLQFGDINLFSRIISVRSRSAKNKYRIRTVPLTDEAQFSVQWLLDRARAFGASLPNHHLLPFRIAPTVWDCNRGTSDSGLKKPWNEVRKASGIAWVRLYDMRHCGLTRLAEAGVPIQVMMSMAGHVSRRMQEHYTHISEQAKRIAVEAAFGAKKQPGSYQQLHQRQSEAIV